MSNALHLFEEAEGDVRFVFAWEKWLLWDGRRWQLDEDGGALRMAENAAKSLYAQRLAEYQEAVQAFRASQSDADEARKKTAVMRLKWAQSSQMSARLKAMLDVVRPFDGVALKHTNLDADHFALCCSNGTVDLRTGRKRPHRREDLMTKIVPVEYDRDAQCPNWEAFLESSLGGDQELITFLQRFTGYALTGSVQEHALVFFYGKGGNGKSTYLNVLRQLLGEYAAVAPRGLLFRTKGGDRHPTELTVLLGSRMVTCAEVAENESLDEALVKDLTGGDRISCRRMGENFWEFDPTHKFFMAGNHKPRIRGADEGIWRRIRLVPWTVQVAKKDPLLSEKLRLELPGILAWAVRGCLDWQANGLGTPSAVAAATAAFRAASDPCEEFLRERCTVHPQARITRQALRAAYEAFQKESGAYVASAEKFAEAVRAFAEGAVTDGKVRDAVGPKNGWHGIRLMTDAELEQRDQAQAETCSYVDTRSTHFPVPPHMEKVDRQIYGDCDSGSTTGYVATAEQSSFDDLLYGIDD